MKKGNGLFQTTFCEEADPDLIAVQQENVIVQNSPSLFVEGIVLIGCGLCVFSIRYGAQRSADKLNRLRLLSLRARSVSALGAGVSAPRFSRPEDPATLIGRRQPPKSMQDHHGQEKKVAGQQAWPKVRNRSTPAGFLTFVGQPIRYFPHGVDPSGPLTKTVQPIFGNSLLPGDRSCQRPGDGTRRICVTATIEDGTHRGFEIVKMTVPGVHHNRHRMVDITSDSPGKAQGVGKLLDGEVMLNRCTDQGPFGSVWVTLVAAST